MPEQSILDARLAEIDRRLRTIQSGLLLTEDPVTPEGEAPVADRTGAAPASVTSIRDPRMSRPAAAAAPPGPPSRDDDLADAGRLVAQLQELAAAHERLVASSRELLTGFADALAAAGAGTPDPVAGPGPAASARLIDAASAPGPPPAVSVTAGPFADTAALRRFERSLSALPEVRDVSVREYIGADRVVVEVHLSAPRS
ncbi:MAG TPA: hypothetical protein VGI07_00620 [Solirubrobacteraceae bacterium]|jgi:hypothetical protein